MTHNRIVTRDEWLAARKAHLAKEKELTRLRDQLSAQRRDLPWVKVDKSYVFEGPNGAETLADLFDDRSQLIIKHFMLGPGWKGGLRWLFIRGRPYRRCSRASRTSRCDLRGRLAGRCPRSKSSGDFHVSFKPEEIEKGEAYYNYEIRKIGIDELSGRSVFYKDANDSIFHTYSSYARGGDLMLGTYNILDLRPKGRNETGPNHNLTDWVRHHDRYESGGSVDLTGRCAPAEDSARTGS
jgi:predicted dithiol-disulfide oxidoreductase (DUF899 family)